MSSEKREPQGIIDTLRVRWGFLFRLAGIRIRTLLACKLLVDDYKHASKAINLGDIAPVGWYTYPFLEHLEACDFSRLKIFEWGGGNSSLMWSAKSRQVVTVEKSRRWCEFVERQSADRENIDVIWAQDRDSYTNSIAAHRDADITIIDGHWRYVCTQKTLENIAPEAAIILDNSEWCPDTCSLLQDNGYGRIDFAGLGSSNHFTWCTSIFFKSPDSPLLNPVRPPSSLSGIPLEESVSMFEGEHAESLRDSEDA